jgi:protocatechuate 3,4-dioxygenase beta subunit
MTTHTKLLSALAVAAVAALAWWAAAGSGPQDLPPTAKQVANHREVPFTREERVAVQLTDPERTADRPVPRPGYATAVQLSGRVTDAYNGRGIAGATVQVNGVGSQTTTDEDGSYVLPFDLPEWAVWLTADHDDYTAANHQLINNQVPTDGAATVDFELAPRTEAAGVTGRLIEASGAGVPGVEVLLSRIHTARLDTARSQPFLSAESGTDGRFVIADIPPGTYTLFAISPEHRDYQRLGIELPRSSRSDLGSIELEPFPWAALVGSVLDVDGDPVNGMEVEVYQGAMRPSVHTDESGAYRIDRILPGSWTVRFTEPNVRLRAEKLEFPHGAEVRHDLVLQSGDHFLGGQVLVDGEPAAGLEVHCEPGDVDHSATWRRWIATTDDEGRFYIEGLETGPVTLWFSRDLPWITYGAPDVDLDRNDHRFEFDTHLRPVTIVGTVRSMDGTPLGAVTVAPTLPLSPAARAVTGTDGTFRIDVQATTDASFNIHARCPGYLPLASTLYYQDANSDGVIEADFTMLPAWNVGTVVGSVTDAQGHPVSQVSVFADSGYGRRWSGLSDSHGIYHLEGVAAGELKIRFLHRSYQDLQATHELAAGQELAVEAQLELLQKFPRTIEVIDASGAPVVDVEVEAWDPRAGYIAGHRTNQYGLATLEDLPSGPVSITVEVEAHLRHKLDHEIEGPLTTPLRMRLTSGGASIRGVILKDDGGPMAEGEISVISTLKDAVRIDHFTNADKEGRFRFDGLPLGEYQLELWTTKGLQTFTVQAGGPDVVLQIK